MTGEPHSRLTQAAVSHARRHPLGTLVLGALIVVGLVIGLDAMGIGQGPAASPAPVAVLDAADLRAAIDAERAGDLAPRDVVADVAIDPSRRTPPLDRQCAPPGQCAVIGTLAGFGDAQGTVTLRRDLEAAPPPIGAADLEAPLALHLSGSGPIEFLGHVRLAEGGRAFGVSAAVAATSGAPVGQVIAATGWLVGYGTPFGCGPVPDPNATPIPEQFRCPPEFLSSRAATPETGNASSQTAGTVPGSVLVQGGAYQEFAPSPTTSGINDVPRLATYLLRMVVADQPNCQGCRGWLLVGRLDAAPVPASPAPDAY